MSLVGISRARRNRGAEWTRLAASAYRACDELGGGMTDLLLSSLTSDEMAGAFVSTASFHIRSATVADIPVILALIRGLADYERLTHEVVATEEDLRGSLFGAHPAAEVLLGEADGQAVAFAVFFTNFSTFLGRPGIYLEDLFVVPEHRRHGFGRRLLQHIAALAVERRCGRLEWSVLDWNEPALRFYRSLGARPMDEWTIHRLTGEALLAFARS